MHKGLIYSIKLYLWLDLLEIRCTGGFFLTLIGRLFFPLESGLEIDLFKKMFIYDWIYLKFGIHVTSFLYQWEGSSSVRKVNQIMKYLKGEQELTYSKKLYLLEINYIGCFVLTLTGLTLFQKILPIVGFTLVFSWPFSFINKKTTLLCGNMTREWPI